MNIQWDAFPNAPGSGAFVCNTDDVPDREARTYLFGEGPDAFSMVVTRRDDELRAYVNYCPHRQSPLNTTAEPARLMTADGERLICAHHMAMFCPLTGLCVEGPARGDNLVSVPLDIRGSAVFVGM
jgi:nitrite reductase/ring-hydroxylating ferredoxin subunit